MLAEDVALIGSEGLVSMFLKCVFMSLPTIIFYFSLSITFTLYLYNSHIP